MSACQLTPEEQACLARCPLLRGAEADVISRLLALPEVTVEGFQPGETLYQPRRFRRALGVLLRGQVEVTNGPLSVSTLEGGELFGAAALYHDAPDYATTLTAKSPCLALFLPQEAMDRLLGEEPVLRRNYLGYLSGRIRFLASRLRSVAQSGAEGKVARYLLANGREGAVHAPATDLARRLGISRASLYRAFEALERAGLIRREGKTICILSHSGLEGVL